MREEVNLPYLCEDVAVRELLYGDRGPLVRELLQRETGVHKVQGLLYGDRGSLVNERCLTKRDGASGELKYTELEYCSRRRP